MGTSWAAIVVNRNGAAFLDGCLRALSGCDLPPAELVVVDNASTDDSLAELAGWPSVIVETCGLDLGYAGAANRGLALTESPVVLLLLPEVEVARDFGSALANTVAAQPRLGLAAPLLLTPDGDIVAAGGVLDRPLLAARRRDGRVAGPMPVDQPADVDFVPGAAMALRRVAVDEVGAFDPAFWPAAYADVDLALRLRALGWAVRYQPALRAIALAPEPAPEYQRNRLRLALKHLSPDEWADQFLPAELARLRHALAGAATPDWPVESGAEAIEALARAGRLARGPGLIDSVPLADLHGALAALAALPPLQLPSHRRLRGDPALERHIEQQRAFNQAVVRALDAQARLSRELTAELLLALLAFLGPGDRPEQRE